MKFSKFTAKKKRFTTTTVQQRRRQKSPTGDSSSPTGLIVLHFLLRQYLFLLIRYSVRILCCLHVDTISINVKFGIDAAKEGTE